MAQVGRLGPKVGSHLSLFCIHRMNRVNSRIDYKVSVLTYNMEVRRGSWDLSFLLPISPADGHYALVAPIV